MNETKKAQDLAVTEPEQAKLTLDADDLKLLDESDLADVDGGRNAIGWPPS